MLQEIRIEQPTHSLFDKYYSASFYDDPGSHVPSDVLRRLEMLGMPLMETLRLNEDPAHGKWHTTEGILAVRRVAPLLKLSSTETKKAEMTFRLHDLGHKLPISIVDHSTHQYGSWWIASKLVADREILSAVLHHNDDVLPPDTPLWGRLAMNIDRELGMGYPGGTRLAISLGFTHPEIEKLQGYTDFEVEGILWDFRDPLTVDFDRVPKMFFQSEVVPYLEERGEFQKVSLLCKRWHEQINGLKISDPWSPPERFASEEDIKKYHMDWCVEPVLATVQSVYKKREDDMYAIRAWARSHY